MPSSPSPVNAAASAKMASHHALELIGVSKIFKNDLLKKKQLAVDNLTCRFASGSCTGLLGHNGAGKTTSIRMILGLTFPDSGKILFEGKPLTTESKRYIGYMPEVNKLPGALTPSELLLQQLRLYRPTFALQRGSIKTLVDESLVKVGLDLHRHKKVRHLSKGMARRLAWALATIHKPRLLILDEPSSGLDPLGRQQMLQWIEEVKKEGTSILLCTHELAQIQTLCDELHVLRRGKLVFSANRLGANRDGLKSDWRQRYCLHVSGADEGALTQIGVRHGLKPWSSFKTEGYLTVIGFDDYADAAAWLSQCLALGLIMIRFGDETLLGETELLRYFSGEA